MEGSYYAVKQRLHSSEPKLAGLSLVVVSGDEIKWQAGDTFLPTLLDLENGEPRLKENLDCKYDIHPLTEKQFKLYQAALEGRACNVGGHFAYADFATKTILLGEI